LKTLQRLASGMGMKLLPASFQSTLSPAKSVRFVNTEEKHRSSHSHNPHPGHSQDGIVPVEVKAGDNVRSKKPEGLL
jgi:hypothetical protein